jgi:hypothetical protein
MASDKPTSQPTPSVPPPKSKEQEEADKALDAACQGVAAAGAELDASAKSLKRTISDSRMRAVRLPTPSQLDLEAPAPKR